MKEKERIASSLMAHINANLDDAVKKKLPDRDVLRDLLNCIADWAYLQRRTELINAGARAMAGKVVEPTDLSEVEIALEDLLKPDCGTSKSTFLDALEDIR